METYSIMVAGDNGIEKLVIEATSSDQAQEFARAKTNGVVLMISKRK